MSKLNRKEFKELLTEWYNNFILERTSPSYKKDLLKFANTKLSDENKRDMLPEFPVSLITIKIDDSNDIFYVKEEIAKIRNNNEYDHLGKNNESTVTLLNNEKNKSKLINSDLINKFLTQEEKSRFIATSFDEHVIIQGEVGDFDNISSEKSITHKTFTLHDIYHSTLDTFDNYAIAKSFFDSEMREDLSDWFVGFENTTPESFGDKNKYNDLQILFDFILSALSGSTWSETHSVGIEDMAGSFFAFLYMFTMVYDNQANRIDMSQSLDNIERLRPQLTRFRSHMGNSFNNVDFAIKFIKEFQTQIFEIFERLYLKSESKYIIISLIG